MKSRLRLLAISFATQMVLLSACFAGNLLTNPGFEDGAAPWTENNWLNNKISFERDQSNPHSGSYCYKMNFVQAVGGPGVQFLYPKLPVKPNQTVKLTFWARGVSNGAALHISLRQGAAPYAIYFRAESGLTDQWQEFVYTFCLPAAIDSKNTQLVFALRQEGVVWIDDVSVTELPPVEEGKPPTENPVRNPSFEAGRDGWTAAFRLREFKTLWEESGSDYPAPEGARLEIAEASDAPDGRKYLSLKVDEKARATLTSAFLPACYGHPMVLRFSLKSDAKREFQAGVGSGKNSNFRLDGAATLTTSGTWQVYEVPVTLRASPGGLYCIEFKFDEPGRYDLDAVSLTGRESADVALARAALAIEPPPNAPAGHLYDLKAEARFRLVLAAQPGAEAQTYKIRIFDFLDREIGTETVKITPDERGYGEADFPVPTGQYGAFRVEARATPPSAPDSQSLDGGGEILAEQIYSVLPTLPPPDERPDSFFGGHVDLTTYNLEIARRAGFRWLRLYPPLSTLWMAVEPAPGEWHFDIEGAKRAKGLGFHLLSIFGTCPDFAADLDPQAVALEKPRWRRSFVPSDLHRWKDYVTRTFTAFSPYIDAWELWNEPDGDYMRFRPGLNRTDVYFSLLKSTREALDETGKPAFLLGAASSNINAELSWALLNKGAGRLLDAFSFHYYDLAAGGNNPDSAYLTPLLEKYRTYQNREGVTLPLWHTEGGIYLYGSQHWLQTYRIPASSAVTPAQGAAAMVRTALFFKASGIKRYFDFYVGASQAGYRTHEDITCGFIEVTGIPGHGIAAHATMVSLVEDAPAVGFEHRDVEGHAVSIAHFLSPKGKVDVYWAGGSSVALTALIGTDRPYDVRDMMGNPISQNEARLSEFPVYVLESPKN